MNVATFGAISIYFSVAVFAFAVWVSWKMPGNWITPTWALCPLILILIALQIIGYLKENDLLRAVLRVVAISLILCNLIMRVRLTNWFLGLTDEEVKNLKRSLDVERYSHHSGSERP
jgi:hypothetical protein